jgi:hypothetical protein
MGSNPIVGAPEGNGSRGARELLNAQAMRTERSASRAQKPSKPAAATRAAEPRPARARRSARAVATTDMHPLATASEVVITDEAIAVRAYEIFLARHDADGDPVSDWLQAERELRPSN